MATKKEINKAKQSKYTKWKGQYKQAMHAGCYLECIFIDYAMMEDRLKSILTHLQLMQDQSEDSCKWVEKPSYKKQARKIIFAPLMNGRKQFPSLRNINIKIKALECLCAVDAGQLPANSLYEIWLSTTVKNKFIQRNVPKLLSDVCDWKNKRNSYVHRLFTAYSCSADTNDLKTFAETGMQYAEELNKLSAVVVRLENNFKNFEAKEKRKAGGPESGTRSRKYA